MWLCRALGPTRGRKLESYVLDDNVWKLESDLTSGFQETERSSRGFLMNGSQELKEVKKFKKSYLKELKGIQGT